MEKIRTILFVDDSMHEHRFFQSALEELKPRPNVIFAWDGEEALNLLQTMATLPDIIFLDLNMPKMSGFETLRQMKHDVRLNPLPVVIYTSSQLEREIDIAKDLGASWFLSKPTLRFLPVALRHILESRDSDHLPIDIFMRKFK